MNGIGGSLVNKPSCGLNGLRVYKCVGNDEFGGCRSASVWERDLGLGLGWEVGGSRSCMNNGAFC